MKERLSDCLLYLVTPSRVPHFSLSEFLTRALDGGVDAVQLRDKELEGGPLLAAAEVVRRATSAAGALFIVNDRIDVAVAAGADGVHLGQNDLPIGEARRLFPHGLVGISTHAEAEVTGAVGAGADYLGVGPVFATPTKPGRPPVGVELVRFAASEASEVPFFAIGDVNEANLEQVVAAGGRRVAVLRALTESKRPQEVARGMRKVLEAAGTLA